MREQKRNNLRQYYLQILEKNFKEEADCDVDEVVSQSNRVVAGITSNDVMRLAADPNFKVKTVTLYADDDMNSSDLIALLKELGAKRKGKRNPNIGFYLKEGAKLLESAGKIPGVELYPDKSGNVAVYFDNASVAPSDKKKPGAGEAKGEAKETTGATTGETKSDTAGTSEGGAMGGSSGAPKSSGDATGGTTTTTTGSATGGTSDDWLGVLWNNAEEEARLARLKARTYDGSFKPDTDGVLCNDDLKHDLKNGYYNGDELIEGILQYNANETKETEAEQKLITLVPLVSEDGSNVFCRLSADQTARAKGLVFITDEDGAKEAEKDTKRFTTRAFGALTFICVLQDDGTMSEAQKKVVKDAKGNEAAQKIGSAWKAYKEKERLKNNPDLSQSRLKNNPDLSQSEESAKVIATFGLEHFLTKAVCFQGVIAVPYEGCCEGKEKEWISALRKLCLFPPEGTRDKVLLITVVDDAKNREACETFVKKIANGCVFDSTEKRMVEADARNGMCFWIVENKFEIPAEKAKDFTFDTPVELLLKSAGELGWDSNGL